MAASGPTNTGKKFIDTTGEKERNKKCESAGNCGAKAPRDAQAKGVKDKEAN